MINKKSLLMLAICIMTLAGCTKWNYVEDNLFEGEWELKGRGFLESMKVKIERSEGALVGTVTQKPEGNKYAELFMSVGDKWVKSISRSSNYSFKLKESRVAAPLFSSYGVSTSEEFRVQFISPDKFGLTTGSSDPKKSAIYYERVK